MPSHLITGAGSGIGAALGHALQERGDDLLLVARSDDRAADLQREYPGADTLVADLADPEGLEQALASARLPDRIDSLVHAAGYVDLEPVADFDLQSWQQHLAVNLTAAALLVRAALPALRAAGGTVVLVNSGAGLSAHPEWSAYAASKFGLRAFAEALRDEESEHGVRVTSVYPGRTATPMQAKVHEQEGTEYDAADWSAPETVARSILHVLDLPADSVIPDLMLRPRPR